MGASAALADIERFFGEPSVDNAKPVMQFIANSPDVMVVMGPALQGLAVGPEVPDDAGPLLLAAYVAGNTKSQLELGRKEDDPIAGFRGLLRTYASLRESSGLSLPKADALQAAEDAGELEAWVAEATAAK